MECKYFSAFSEVVEHSSHEVSINPMSRMKKIFKDFFSDECNNISEKDINTLFDISLHYIANIELLSGLSKDNIRLALLDREINYGKFSDIVKDEYLTFSYVERQFLLKKIVFSIENGISENYFKEVFYFCFPNGAIVFKDKARNEFILYFTEKNNDNTEKKIKLITYFFLPMSCKYSVVYRYHPYLIGLDETANIGKIRIL